MVSAYTSFCVAHSMNMHSAEQGLIPLGQSFTLLPPVNSSNFTWLANVAAGTSIVFMVQDSEGRLGGSSDLETVSASDDLSCIDASSPHSTVSAATQTSAPHQTEAVSVNSGMGTGEIAGIAIGSVALAAALISLLVLCLLRSRRRRSHRDAENSSLRSAQINNDRPILVGNPGSSRVSRVRGSFLPPGRRRQRGRSVDLLPPTSAASFPQHFAGPSTSSLPPPSQYEPDPFTWASEASAVDGHSNRTPSGSSTNENDNVTRSTSHMHSRQYSHTSHNSLSQLMGETNPSSPVTTQTRRNSQQTRRSRYLSASQSAKSASEPLSPKSLSRYSTPRFILHTDAEDHNAVLEGDDTVELPPSYTDRRDSRLPDPKTPPPPADVA